MKFEYQSVQRLLLIFKDVPQQNYTLRIPDLILQMLKSFFNNNLVFISFFSFSITRHNYFVIRFWISGILYDGLYPRFRIRNSSQIGLEIFQGGPFSGICKKVKRSLFSTISIKFKVNGSLYILITLPLIEQKLLFRFKR